MVYDVMVLGGGPGGYIAAERAGHTGLSVLLIEKGDLGGVCLNEGCIPSKALLHSAKLYDYAKGDGEPYGVSYSSPTLDHSTVIARKDAVVETLVNGVRAQMRQNHVTVIQEHGVIQSADGQQFTVEAGNSSYNAKKLVIATGSSNAVPLIPGLREGLASGFVITNREALSLDKLPSSMVIIGGGIIGLELASYFHSAGCPVTILERMDHIAGAIDRQLSETLRAHCEKKGMRIVLGANVTELGEGYVLYKTGGGNDFRLECGTALLAAGRQPAVTGAGLESLGIQMERGAIVIDEFCRTNRQGVYAVGDCTGKIMLAHTAYRQGEVAVNHILGIHDPMDYTAIPSVIYTNPEVGCVGLTLEQAQGKGIDAVEVSLPMSYSGRYLAESGEQSGLCKLVFDRKYHVLIGAHIMANYASEFILACGIMVSQKLSVDEIKRIVFPHPTVGEIIRECAFAYRK